MSQSIAMFCPAKVNLALRVGPVDRDGFHPIRSWMSTISFGDDLHVERLADDAPSTFQINWAEDAPRPGAVDWPIEDDLACRAAQITEQHIGRPLPVAVTLNKRTPTGAGLGGGSSDGAGMLAALNQLFQLNLEQAHLLALASHLGSDVPFFLEPTGSSLVGGRGEKLEPIAPTAVHLALILPDLTCPTGPVYGRFDQLNPKAAFDPDSVDGLAQSGALKPEGPFNDLAEPACDLVPELATLRAECLEAVQRPVHVTGSGAAMFVVAQDHDEAQSLAQTVFEKVGLTALAVHGPHA